MLLDSDGREENQKGTQRELPEEKILVFLIEWKTESIKHETEFGSFGPFTRIKRSMLLLATMPSYRKVSGLFKKFFPTPSNETAQNNFKKYLDFLQKIQKIGKDHQCIFNLKQTFIDADEAEEYMSKYILTLRFDGLGWTVKWHDKQYFEQYRGYRGYIQKKNPGLYIPEIGPDEN